MAADAAGALAGKARIAMIDENKYIRLIKPSKDKSASAVPICFLPAGDRLNATECNGRVLNAHHLEVGGHSQSYQRESSIPSVTLPLFQKLCQASTEDQH